MHAAAAAPAAIRRRLGAVAVAIATLTGTAVATSAAADVATIDQPAACCERAHRVEPPEPPRSAETIGLIGDSLAVGVTNDRFLVGPSIQGALGAQGRELWFNTTVSMTLADGRDLLASMGTRLGTTDLLVVALGTNNIVGTGDPTTMRNAIDQLVDAVNNASSGTHIVWVDLAFPRLADRAATFNAVLDDITAIDPDFHRCRWSDAIAANPGWYASDRIHMTGTGYAARRDVIISCIDAVDVSL